jgi:heme exporter protein D
MSSFHEFLTMGGYAAYVWPAYGIGALVVVANVLAPVRRLKHLKDDIRRRKAGSAP